MLPELAIIGYPPEDLVLRRSVIDACHEAIACLVRESCTGPALIATTPWRESGRVFNAAIVIDRGALAPRFKCDLPNYGVFDEKRVFSPGPFPEPVNFRGIRIGIPVCEDIWTPAVTAHLAQKRAEFFIVPNGLPFEAGKFSTRMELARARTRETSRALCTSTRSADRTSSCSTAARLSSTIPARWCIRCPDGPKPSIWSG